MHEKARQYIFICTGKDCKKNGSKELLKELKKYRKGKKLRVIKTKCMDHCKKGPNAIIDNTIYHYTTAGELITAIEKGS